MTNDNGGLRRKPSPFPQTDRQLTVGEMIGMIRYGPHVASLERGEAHLEAVLEFLDHIEVCTTCGWSRTFHETASVPPGVAHICAHWTREI